MGIYSWVQMYLPGSALRQTLSVCPQTKSVHTRASHVLVGLCVSTNVKT